MWLITFVQGSWEEITYCKSNNTKKCLHPQNVAFLVCKLTVPIRATAIPCTIYTIQCFLLSKVVI